MILDSKTEANLYSIASVTSILKPKDPGSRIQNQKLGTWTFAARLGDLHAKARGTWIPEFQRRISNLEVRVCMQKPKEHRTHAYWKLRFVPYHSTPIWTIWAVALARWQVRSSVAV